MERIGVFLLPVRRRLLVVIVGWLCGIYAAQLAALPMGVAVMVCALLGAAAVISCLQHRSALLYCVLLSVLAGNAYAGMQLGQKDFPTAYGVHIEGSVCAIESGYRVMLRDVTADGVKLTRRAVVTLMTGEEETRTEAMVGQRIIGTGRLFAQEEARNPGASNARIRALSEGYELSGYILPGWTAEGKRMFSLREWIRGLRTSLLEAMERVFGEHAPFFQAVMLGERDELDADLVEAMQLTGTVHILTVSGLHMTIIAGAASWLLRHTGLSRWACLAAEALLLSFFTALTGGAAGTLRAMCMALMRTLARCCGRSYDSLTALAVSAAVITLANPVQALTVSFQMSYFIVLGIVLLSRNADRLMRGVPDAPLLREAASGIWIGFTAQLAAVPINLVYYGFLPVLGLPMNLLTSACVPVMMLAGWILLPIGVLVPELCVIPAQCIGQAAALFERLCLSVGALRYAILRLPAPHALTLVLLIASAALISRRIRFGRGNAVCAAAVVGLFAALYMPRFDPAPRYVQLDVGQGDCAVLRSGRHAVLMDVGPAYCYDALRYLRHEGLFVDAVILSHLDEDHAGALSTLIRSEISVPSVVIAEGALRDADSAVVTDALALAESKGISLRAVDAGDRLSLSWLQAEVLSPPPGIEGSNERSLLLHAQIAGKHILMTGDLPAECEPEVLPDCDILKVAHHGSKNATSAALLAMTSPECAVISVGAGNAYGHPSPRVLDDLAAVDAHVYRTDQSGCITLWLDEDIRAQTYIHAVE
ncbi:MAG: DNA internalization-related competence protein ComEC/Rec2 [Clostridia bacterium]|nr:DNA internalization-related competence protein ComEC/Rec2 [Clostridia bacterium]